MQKLSIVSKSESDTENEKDSFFVEQIREELEFELENSPEEEPTGRTLGEPKIGKRESRAHKNRKALTESRIADMDRSNDLTVRPLDKRIERAMKLIENNNKLTKEAFVVFSKHLPAQRSQTKELMSRNDELRNAFAKMKLWLLGIGVVTTMNLLGILYIMIKAG